MQQNQTIFQKQKLTVILRATLSNWEASSLILWTMRSREPPSKGGRERWASTVLPDTKCNWTAAWSFFSANRPCHTIGYFCRKKTTQSDLKHIAFCGIVFEIHSMCDDTADPQIFVPSKAVPCQWTDVLNVPA